MNENDPIELEELQPVVIAKVSEVTGGGSPSGGDDDNVVWGNF
jgi:hypothetical protein